MNYSLNWTTLDEINYIRQIYLGQTHIPNCSDAHPGRRTVDQRITYLREYLDYARKRNWHGIGLSVDPHAIILQAMDYLEDLTRQRNNDRPIDPLDHMLVLRWRKARMVT